MIETSEDKLVRILTRASFEEMDRQIRLALSGKSHIEFISTNEVYSAFGWKREEYHQEVKRRAANRG